MLNNCFVSICVGRASWLGGVCLLGLLTGKSSHVARMDGNGGFIVVVPEAAE